LDKPQRGRTGLHAQRAGLLEPVIVDDINEEERERAKQASIVDVEEYKHE